MCDWPTDFPFAINESFDLVSERGEKKKLFLRLHSVRIMSQAVTDTMSYLSGSEARKLNGESTNCFFVSQLWPFTQLGNSLYEDAWNKEWKTSVHTKNMIDVETCKIKHL